MLVVAEIDGYSESIRSFRTEDLVRNEVAFSDVRDSFYSRSNVLSKHRFKRFVVANGTTGEDDLLCVGKSLGGKKIIQALNALPQLRRDGESSEAVCRDDSFHGYRRVVVVIIDANWPLLTNWTPNLGDRFLDVWQPVDALFNIRVVASSASTQAGAKIRCPFQPYRVFESRSPYFTHTTIVRSVLAKRAIHDAVELLNTGGIPGSGYALL